MKRSAGSDGSSVQARVVVFDSSEILENLPDVIRTVTVAASLPQSEWKKYVPQTLGLIGFSAGVPQILRHSEPRTLADLARMYPKEKWTAPVIVAVDESQAFPGSMHDSHALFLRGIHNAVGKLPLSLVLAGLGDTKDRADDMNLTRGLKIHGIGGLDASSVSGLMRDFCERFGLDPFGHGARLDALAAPAQGWPRHLYFTMKAFSVEALRCGGDLGRADWTRIADEAAESRIRYYSGQQSEHMKEAKGLTAAVMHGLRDGMDIVDVMQLIEENVRDRVGHRMPEGMNSSSFFKHLIHQGALQMRDDDTAFCPIPSFRTYLTEAGGMTYRTPDPSSSGDGTESFGM